MRSRSVLRGSVYNMCIDVLCLDFRRGKNPALFRITDHFLENVKVNTVEHGEGDPVSS